MLTIRTKKVFNKWYCCATIDGYDYSFTGISMNQARYKMRVKLHSCGKTNYAIWEEPIIYTKRTYGQMTAMQVIKIDSRNNIV